MPYSAIARDYLLREGLLPDRIVKTGSPMKEVIEHHGSKIHDSKVLENLGVKEGSYFVVSCHREENIEDDRRLTGLIDTLNTLASTYNYPVIVSTHPRTRKRFDERKVKLDPRVRTLPPLGFSDYVRLQMSSKCTLSDSGTITEESSILGFPAVNLREAHERPEGMEEAVVPMAGLTPDHVLQCVEMVIRRKERGGSIRAVADYDVGNVSEKVLNIILSYTPYVNRVVWRKP
jgi:UDP-N-acetylglucosamine 2-epimerase (non-hydrolysing)